jgi:arylsulfatase A-like enzyme
LWHDAIPTFSLLWLSEPDDTEHKTAPGSSQALAAIKSSDDNLGRVLTALEKQNATSTTDVFVVSDHGFSTISRSIDVPKILRDAGFDAVTQFAGEPKPGQVMVVGNGGTVLFYVIGHDETVTRRLVEFLQRSDFAGVIFTRAAMDGTFTFEQAKIDSPLQNYGATHNEQGPDVEMAFRWSKDKNRFGIAGMIDADWQRAAGEGTHATLSRYDMHNTLIAAGPDFRRGETDDLPSGNVDLAPTICSILQIEPTAMDGRILSEALSAGQSPTSETHKIEAGKNFSNGRWQQELKISRIGETIYLDEGNGFFEHQQ